MVTRGMEGKCREKLALSMKIPHIAALVGKNVKASQVDSSRS
jgi:hypothetical protein